MIQRASRKAGANTSDRKASAQGGLPSLADHPIACTNHSKAK
jgi:hypothetical protein